MMTMMITIIKRKMFTHTYYLTFHRIFYFVKQKVSHLFLNVNSIKLSRQPSCRSQVLKICHLSELVGDNRLVLSSWASYHYASKDGRSTAWELASSGPPSVLITTIARHLNSWQSSLNLVFIIQNTIQNYHNSLPTVMYLWWVYFTTWETSMNLLYGSRLNIHRHSEFRNFLGFMVCKA